jgi:hypothetical protein
MVKGFYQNLQTLVAGEFFVKIAFRFFSLSETTKFLCRLFHEVNIRLAAAFSERI